jgi:hypothetical protein
LIVKTIEDKLKNTCTHFDQFALAFDGSTDVSNTAQLAIFIRVVDLDYNVTEEMLTLQPMKDTTISADLISEY